jgi:hypothetical protein
VAAHHLLDIIGRVVQRCLKRLRTAIDTGLDSYTRLGLGIQPAKRDGNTWILNIRDNAERRRPAHTDDRRFSSFFFLEREVCLGIARIQPLGAFTKS